MRTILRRIILSPFIIFAVAIVWLVGQKGDALKCWNAYWKAEL